MRSPGRRGTRELCIRLLVRLNRHPKPETTPVPLEPLFIRIPNCKGCVVHSAKTSHSDIIPGRTQNSVSTFLWTLTTDVLTRSRT